MQLVVFLLYIFIGVLCFRIARKIQAWNSNPDDEDAVFLGVMSAAWPITLPLTCFVATVFFTVVGSGMLIRWISGGRL